jgi:Na+/alanine symporter
MAIIYIVIVLVIIVIDIDQLPGVIALVLLFSWFWSRFWFSSSMGCKRGILMKQVKGQRRILPRQQMFLTHYKG